MIAYKFLALGAVGRFSGFVWPRPDTRHYQWVTTDRVELCNSGIHACRLQDLPFWLDDELWQTGRAYSSTSRPGHMTLPASSREAARSERESWPLKRRATHPRVLTQSTQSPPPARFTRTPLRRSLRT